MQFHDDWVREDHKELAEFARVQLSAETLAGCDCVVIVTAHDGVDYQFIVDNAPLIVDTRNVLKDIRSDRIVKL